MMRKCKIVLSLFLLWKDWWSLFQKAKIKGVDSVYDYAARIKLRLSQSYIGHDAKIAGRPFFPHGLNGIYISGGLNWAGIVLFSNK